jgi:hypothetical protein
VVYSVAMTRRPALAALLVVLCAANGTRAQPVQSGSVFSGETSVQLNIAVISPYGGPGPEPFLSAGTSAVWRPKLAGMGVGVKALTATRYLSLVIAPQLRTELWWFTLSGGWLFDLFSDDRPASLGAIVSLGISPDLLRFAWGKLGLDLTVDCYVPVGVEVTTPSLVEPLLDSWGWTGRARDFVELLLSNPVFGIGITYRFPL